MYTSPMRYLLPLSLVALLISGCNTATPPAEEEGTTPETTAAITVAWEVTEEAPGAYDQPNFSLALVVKGEEEEKIALGTYAGSFVGGEDSPVKVEGALLTGASWWAGAGDEFYVMKTSDTELTVYHRGVEEESEPGEYTVLKTVEILGTATIEVTQ